MRPILIVGARDVGKTTLIRRLLSENSRPVRGFYTEKRLTDPPGTHSTYLYPAWLSPEERTIAPSNLVGRWDGQQMQPFPQVFDTLGVACLRDVPADALVVMDELGFLESQAPRFTQAVLDTLNGPAQVIAAVKDRPDVPFLQAVLAHPQALVFRLTPDHRQSVFQQIRALLSSPPPYPLGTEGG